MKNVALTIITMLLLVTIACDQSDSALNTNEYVKNDTPAQNLSKSSSRTLIIGPITFTRDKGKPRTEEIEFTIESNYTDTKLLLVNGGADKSTKITSCVVVFNSDTVIHSIDIDKEVENIQVDIILKESNLLKVKVAGAPSSYCTIQIEGEEGCPCSVTDKDGNVYQTITIGDQCWMAENLKVTHYRNGDIISKVTNNQDWINLTSGAYCSFNNNDGYISIYGHLYNWYAINDNRNIAPRGWHVPSIEEWRTLVDFLGGDAVAGSMLKETGTSHWSSPNGTNESGFTALPGGYRGWYDGICKDMGYHAFFWTSTEWTISLGWYAVLYADQSVIAFDNSTGKRSGFSIRCIRD